jgi:hypothetical protein
MKRFSDLLMFRPGDNPADIQQQARLRFPTIVAQSKLSLRHSMAPASQTGTHVILGVASYSRPELELLDEIDASLSSGNGRPTQVDVFDVLDCPQMSDFAKLSPGLQVAHQTPVLGVMVDGKLAQSVAGLPQVEEVLRQYHILTPHSIST